MNLRFVEAVRRELNGLRSSLWHMTGRNPNIGESG